MKAHGASTAGLVGIAGVWWGTRRGTSGEDAGGQITRPPRFGGLRYEVRKDRRTISLSIP